MTRQGLVTCDVIWRLPAAALKFRTVTCDFDSHIVHQDLSIYRDQSLAFCVCKIIQSPSIEIKGINLKYEKWQMKASYGHIDCARIYANEKEVKRRARLNSWRKNTQNGVFTCNNRMSDMTRNDSFSQGKALDDKVKPKEEESEIDWEKGDTEKEGSRERPRERSQHMIGDALKKLFEDCTIKREDLWITSELWLIDL
ncbi:hypothetical protein Scep_021396 [Stephania cephalantha]|uniref:Uncharacterized protein n=1 Tax=Stephania cephalantha TaxID=152367 RepID=A0AAP0F8W9_9MAGN